ERLQWVHPAGATGTAHTRSASATRERWQRRRAGRVRRGRDFLLSTTTREGAVALQKAIRPKAGRKTDPGGEPWLLAASCERDPSSCAGRRCALHCNTIPRFSG